ncbi:MAG: outer membrane protein [Bryobacterales bacterium]|jgi:putative membrane protein|nr:outer membrane protein [Bryobacterales bacterium]
MRNLIKNSVVAGLISFGIVGGAAAIAQAPGGAGGAGGAGQGQQPSRPQVPTSPDMNGPAAGQAGTPSSSKAADEKFAKEAAVGGLAEVELGRIASQKASSDAVKQFGQKMVDDHTKANDELKQVASQSNLTLPTTLDKKHQSMVAKMSAMSGPDFDKAYVKDMVKDHEKDVKEFQNEADKGTDPNLKQFATKTLPVLQGHLASIKAISQQTGGGGK